MERLSDAFTQSADGSWICKRPVHIVGPNGPATIPKGTYQRGQLVNGYDIAAWLDECKANGPPPGIQVL